jgi:DNA-binding CsgD family transcriptional regulator
MAMADDLPEHVARAYTNIGAIAVVNRRLAEADRQLRAGIAYCRDRDLDSWQLYMSAWLARSLAERGRYEAADATAREVLRHPQLSPITRITASVVAGQLAARRGRPDASALDTALTLAQSTGEAQRLAPVAAARAEAAWLAGEPERIVAEVDRAWAAVVAHPQRWQLGELAWWLAVAGDRRPLPVELPRPFALLLAGAWSAAAAAWRELGCPLWCAMALGRGHELDDARLAVQELEALGATAVRDALLRDRHTAGLAVPRGPRAVTRGNPYGLTAREIDILGLLVDGLSNAELAERLFLSQKTVGHHVSAILRKLDVPTRSRAVALASQEGIVAKT